MQINPKALSTTCMKDPAKNKANGRDANFLRQAFQIGTVIPDHVERTVSRL